MITSRPMASTSPITNLSTQTQAMKHIKKKRGRKPLLVQDLEEIAIRLYAISREIDRIRTIYLSAPSSKMRIKR